MPKFTSVASPRRRSARPLPADERGFTIIELTVALGLLAIVGAAIAGVFWSSIRTAGTSNHRTDGASIASREIESMRSVPYTSVGFYADQTGYTSTFEGLDTVTLGATTPSIPAQIQPQTPDPAANAGFAPDPDPSNASYINLGGINFSVTRAIVWVNAADASTTYTQAYKRLTVTVTWHDTVGTHTARQDSLLYPGGQGPYAGAKGASSATTVAPTTVALVPTTPVLAAAVVPADPTGRTEIDLSWTQPTGGAAVTSYTVQYSTDPTFAPTATNAIPNQPPGATTFPVTGLASSTTYYFQVTAVASPQTATSNAVSAMTLAQPTTTCTAGPLIVTGSTSLSTTGTILKKHGNKSEMSENLTLGFSTTGNCPYSFVVKATAPDGSSDPSSPYPLVAGGSGSYSAGVLSSGVQGWSVGLHTFIVWNNTTNAATTAVKTFKVCAIGSLSC
jgi:prepilin-type N-terminal cleavage/methylation domain-containing protein